MILPAQRHSAARNLLRRIATGPAALAFLPALALAAFWLGGEGWLIVIALAVPLAYAIFGLFDQAPPENRPTLGLEPMLDHALAEASRTGRRTACLMVEFDDFAPLRDRYGTAAASLLASKTMDRLRGAVREADHVLSPSPGRFALVVAPMRQLDLEIMIQIAGRLQAQLEDPLVLDGQTVYLSCSIGFVLDSQLRAATGREFRTAAETALDQARAHGPSAIRSWAPHLPLPAAGPHSWGADDTARALQEGQISPWFQPQVSTDTGHLTGVEALARWHHPTLGLIPPGDFLPVMQQAAQLERLGEVILSQSLATLRQWDRQGLEIPMVAVNFTAEDLRNPRMVDKIRWELDRFDLGPDRLCIEVLETVIASTPDDIVARNINGLAALGCRIDLDDFGTGHASISSIRRFPVGRLKIDRSFVLKVDRDPEQQKMVSVILTMAERLNLDVLAEGVETSGEHAMLAQLGCAHVQGFGIARPMPADKLPDWLENHQAKLGATPQIGRTAQ